MTAQNDTIAAIATGLTPAGIGIVRISGPDSTRIMDRIFVNKEGDPVSLQKPNRIHYGFIHVSRETMDEVLVMNMKAPHSYTGEDTVEINCHGGPLMMKKVLQTVLENGARLAEPGEFTKRAFLNGRIDLSQAEAVTDIINAKNDRAVKAGVSQLKGSVSEAVRRLRDRLLGETAYIEAALDDPEHYDLDRYGDELLPKLEKLYGEISGLIGSYRYGKLVKEGINTCILGKPNAGKSSLLNAMLGENRAIVTEIPGTTRDVIRESIQLGDLSLNIMDTAGIRETSDRVERIGVEKAFEFAKQADLILYVIDRSVPMDESDREIIRFIRENGCRAIYLLNKSDLEAEELPEIADVSRETIEISARNGDGIGQIIRRIEELFDCGSISYNDEVMISSERHLGLLKQAAVSVANVIQSVQEGLPEDFYTIDLMDAYHSLGLIIGEETEDDLADRIFSEFCMGK